jgi:hypothetical protein
MFVGDIKRVGDKGRSTLPPVKIYFTAESSISNYIIYKFKG